MHSLAQENPQDKPLNTPQDISKDTPQENPEEAIRKTPSRPPITHNPNPPLLNIGMFLESFDITLCLHMILALNLLFFPKQGPFETSLSLTFSCFSLYALSPFGMHLWQWVGNRFGQPVAVFFSCFCVGISCFSLAFLPSYASIGAFSVLGITACRLLQGLAQSGATMATEILVTEGQETGYGYLAWHYISRCLGGVVAIVTVYAIIHSPIDWPLAFWVASAGMALWGAKGRAYLHNAQNIFPDYKTSLTQTVALIPQRISKRRVVLFTVASCVEPVYTCFAYIFCPLILLHTFDYTLRDVVVQNMAVVGIQLIGAVVTSYFSKGAFALMVVFCRNIILSVFTMVFPALLLGAQNSFDIFVIQIMVAGSVPHFGAGIFYKHLKVAGYGKMLPFARLFLYGYSMVGMVFLTSRIGFWSAWLCLFPFAISFFASIAVCIQFDRGRGLWGGDDEDDIY